MKKIVMLMFLFLSVFIVSCGGSDSSSAPDAIMSNDDAKVCDGLTEVVREAVGNFTGIAGFPTRSPLNNTNKNIVAEIVERTMISKASASKGTWDNEDYYGTGLLANGSYEFDGTTSFNYTITITFKDYEPIETIDGVQCILNGTATIESTMTEGSDGKKATSSFKEDLDVKVGDVEHKISSDYVMTFVGDSIIYDYKYTKKGTYVFDGESYKVEKSGTDE